MDAQRRNRIATTLAATALLAALLSACAATPDGPAATLAESPAAAATRTSTPPPTPLAFPPTSDDEIARAEFRDPGPDGIAQGSSVTSNLIEADEVSILGECIGTRAHYELFTASVDTQRRSLTSGIMQCGVPIRTDVAGLGYTGPVQLSFTDTNGVSEGWVRVVPALS